jgi:hypothetical protein
LISLSFRAAIAGSAVTDRKFDFREPPAENLGAEGFQLICHELHQLAARKMAQEKPGQTLRTTALANERWLDIWTYNAIHCSSFV